MPYECYFNVLGKGDDGAAKDFAVDHAAKRVVDAIERHRLRLGYNEAAFDESQAFAQILSGPNNRALDGNFAKHQIKDIERKLARRQSDNHARSARTKCLNRLLNRSRTTIRVIILLLMIPDCSDERTVSAAVGDLTNLFDWIMVRGVNDDFSAARLRQMQLFVIDIDC
jgi:hypothetical protein